MSSLSEGSDTKSSPKGRRGRKLRTRLLVSFAVGGLLLAVAVSALTYVLVRRNLVDQRESTATRQALVNARLLANSLRSPDVDVPRLMSNIVPAGAGAVVRRSATADDPADPRGTWFTSSLTVQPDILPTMLKERVLLERQPVRQHFRHDGPQLAIGVPLPNGVSYFEVFPLAELDRDLSILRFSLAGASGITLALSVGLGSWFSRRLLGPVVEVGATARSIAGGTLDARLGVSQPGSYQELAGLAASFNDMVDSLQERVERDARFASNVSHELRSPLTTLKSAISALQTRRDQLDAPAARMLDILTEEVDRFQELVQDLLEISRIDAKVAGANFEKVAVAQLVLEALGSSDPNLPAAEVDPEAFTTFVRADKRRLERVIQNLVRNAEKYGGGVVAIRVGISHDRARLEVEDRGPGIAPEERAKVFERFYRGQGAGRRGSGDGVGLGLAIVAEHVRVHDGSVWVEEPAEGGARFVVELPRVTR